MPLSHNPKRTAYESTDRPVQVVDLVRPGFVWFLAILFAMGFIIWIACYLFG